jgi:hypothetical protein
MSDRIARRKYQDEVSIVLTTVSLNIIYWVPIGSYALVYGIKSPAAHTSKLNDLIFISSLMVGACSGGAAITSLISPMANLMDHLSGRLLDLYGKYKLGPIVVRKDR